MARPETDEQPETEGCGRRRALLMHAATLSIVSFALHFAWENAQCRLFIHLATEPTQWAMVRASAGDVLLTWIAQVVVAAVAGEWLWSLGPWGRRVYLTMGTTAVGLSIGFELFATSTGRWTYTELNPVIAGVALTPVLQLLILFPASFALTRHIARWLVSNDDEEPPHDG